MKQQYVLFIVARLKYDYCKKHLWFRIQKTVHVVFCDQFVNVIERSIILLDDHKLI